MSPLGPRDFPVFWLPPQRVFPPPWLRFHLHSQLLHRPLKGPQGSKKLYQDLLSTPGGGQVQWPHPDALEVASNVTKGKRPREP